MRSSARSGSRGSALGDSALGAFELLASRAPAYALAGLAFISLPRLPLGLFIADLALLACLARIVIRSPDLGALTSDPVLGAGLLFWGWAALTTLWNVQRGGVSAFVGIGSLAMLGWCLAAYGAVTVVADSRVIVVRIALIVIAAACVNSAIALVAWLAYTGGVIGRYNFTPPLSPGFGAQFGFARMGFLLALGLLAGGAAPRGTRMRWTLVAALLLTGSTFVIVLTRTELLVTPFLATAVYLLCMQRRAIRWGARVLGSLGFIAIVAVAVVLFGRSVPWLGDVSGADLVSHSVLGRLMVWRLTWALFLQHPVVGIGLGGALETVGQVEFLELGAVNRFATPHNGVLGFLLETGVIGLVVAIAFFVITIRWQWRSYRRSMDPALRAVITVALVQTLWLAISHVTVDTVVLISIAQRGAWTFVVYQWILLALGSAAARVDRR